MLRFFNRKKKVALVLGGGSARGIAHIGVLKVFEREKIPIDLVVGTSMGAFIGAAYAVGVPMEEMEHKAYHFSSSKLMDWTMPKMGVLAGDKLEKQIVDIIGEKTFRDCKIPLCIVTTDIEKGEELAFDNGDLIKLIRASCSWPGIFNPVKIDGRLLVDGGIKNSVPTKVARAIGGFDYMIAVDVGFCVKDGKISNIFQMIIQSFQIMGHELNKYQAKEADMVIEVPLDDLDQVAFERSKEAVHKGMLAAEAKIKQIKKELGL
jgi:NTE family protein